MISALTPFFLLTLRLFASPAEPARAPALFRLYKFQQPIGLERALRVREAGGTTEIRTSFSFTDRTTTVPLSATLTLAKDGSVQRFEAWGATSRFATVDDRVSVAKGEITIEQGGSVTRARAPS